MFSESHLEDIKNRQSAFTSFKEGEERKAASKISNSKRNLLKKTAFDSDMCLSTGRFQPTDEDGEAKNFSKSANQAQVLSIIN
mmetsp:Transcript_12265/g.19015  ORF Transcript_12265/g.19015 Transcript_12265/m.19015 type:complete len:83 (+) Transcript_12265:153-401(+)